MAGAGSIYQFDNRRTVQLTQIAPGAGLEQTAQACLLCAPGLVPSPGTEALTLSAIVAAALLLTIGLYFGIRRRLRPRGPRRRASSRGEAASGATKEPTSGVPTAT